MKEKGAWQTKGYQWINSRVFFLNPGFTQTFLIEVYYLDYHKMIHWHCFVLLFSLNSIPFHVDLTLEQNTFSVNPFSPRLPFVLLFLQLNTWKITLLELELDLFPFGTVWATWNSPCCLLFSWRWSWKCDQLEIKKKTVVKFRARWARFFYFSGIANRGKLKTDSNVQNNLAVNINGEAIN